MDIKILREDPISESFTAIKVTIAIAGGIIIAAAIFNLIGRKEKKLEKV